MADYFVKHTGLDTNDGLSWATCKATLAGALAVAVGGVDRVFVSNMHAETASGTPKTQTSAGTPAAPVAIYSVSDAVTPAPGVVPGGAVSVTGTAALNMNGSMIVHGLTLNGTGGSSSGSVFLSSPTTPDTIQTYSDCAINLNTTNTASAIQVGASGSSNSARSRIVLNNCAVKTTSYGSRIEFYQEFTWRGGSYQGSSTQTHLFRSGANGRGVPVTIEGVDFTGMGLSTSLVSGTQATGRFMFRNCALPVGWTGQLAEGALDPGLRVEMHNCDSGDTNYRLWVAAFAGSIRSETGIVKSGGASDGTTAHAWKMETNTNPTPGLVGLESPELARWNAAVGSPVTVSIDVLVDSGTLTNAEAWLDVQFLGTSGLPKGSFVSSRAAPLAAPAAIPASPATWTNGGARTPQRISVTFTPQEAGWIQCKLSLAKPSTILYVDPKPVVS